MTTENETLRTKVKDVSSGTDPKYIDSLTDVPRQHKDKLKDFNYVFRTKPDGSCFTSCVAQHVYKDAEQSLIVKKRINNHIADNWDSFYSNKISFP